MTQAPYAELHCVSNFSFLRGASHPHELVHRAAALGYQALAITDECSMAGTVRAHEAARTVGLQLIIGSEIRCTDGTRLVLLAPDHDAYSEICELITQARRRSRKGDYRVVLREDTVKLHHALVLWIPAAAADYESGRWIARQFPGRAWIAGELHCGADDGQRIIALDALGEALDLPRVACGDVHMHLRERRALQDLVTAVRHRCTVHGAGERLFPNGERHLRERAELQRIYPPAWRAQTLEIAERCSFSLAQLRYEYPCELVPSGHTATSHLRQLTQCGMHERWPHGVPAVVQAQIEQELALIAHLRYESFFLTVHDVVRFARSRGILCQGRGSAANSAVCYALGITAVNPVQQTLLFERFISLERNEPPDIDVDFEHHRREEVIQYVYDKYGRHRAALAATVICYRLRSAVRDVGRALGLSLDQINAFSKALAWWDHVDDLAQRLREQGLDPEAPVLQRLRGQVDELLGFPRHLSQHVGGFVISEQALSQLVPVENAAMPERTIIQWDKEDLESLGLLKVDCLALGMLSAIRRALEFVEHRYGRPFTLTDVPLEDPAVYDLISRGETLGVFQIESRAQMAMLPRMKPRCFYDLVIEVAIVRPGPIQGGMVHPYLRRRQGLESIEESPAPLRAVLARTLGVPIFQEQVMQIAVAAAGFSPGEADQVRRSMAAWSRKGGLEHFRERLMRGMAERGYSREFAERIYQQILGFGSYGFPESHAASFALLVYVSAWLKCHEPAAFTAAMINAQPMGFYAPAQLVQEGQRAGVEVRAIDVQVSDWDCSLEPKATGQPAVRLGLRLVAGLNEETGHRIEVERRRHAFSSADELNHRAALDARARRALANAGALQSLAGHRRQARWKMLGVEILPGFLAGQGAAEDSPLLVPPSEGADIIDDYRFTGVNLRRHPVALLRPRLQRQGVRSARALKNCADASRVRVAGLVLFRQRPGTASGVVFISLEDETGMINLIIWPKILEAQRRVVLGAKFMIVDGHLQSEQGVIHVIAEQMQDHSDWIRGLPLLSRDFH